MVLLASRHGEIKMIEPTLEKPKTVRQAIGRLRALSAGEAAPRDKLHVSSDAVGEESQTHQSFEAGRNVA
jgi:DNA (cytosine-5)-methyltransferase 1